MASSSKKRSAEETERMRRALLVPGVSERACGEICEIMAGKPMKRKMKRAKTTFLQPFVRCLESVSLDCDDGSVFAWSVCCPEAILQKFLQTKDYCYHVERALRNNAGSLTPILYEDEAVAGNVLGPLQQSKCNLYYLSFLAASLLLNFSYFKIATPVHVVGSLRFVCILGAQLPPCRRRLDLHCFAESCCVAQGAWRPRASYQEVGTALEQTGVSRRNHLGRLQ